MIYVNRPDDGDYVFLREKPSTGSMALGVFYNGSQGVMLADTYDQLNDPNQDGPEMWHVRFDGIEGYMMGSYLGLVGIP